MPSMTPMMSTIFCDDSLIEPIVSTTCATTALPRAAISDAPCASWLAWRALSAFWRTVDVSSSIDAAVSSSAPACCSVRADRSALPWLISVLATATLSELWRTRASTRWSLATKSLNPPAIFASSSLPLTSMRALRSALPPASPAMAVASTRRGLVRRFSTATSTAAAATAHRTDTSSV